METAVETRDVPVSSVLTDQQKVHALMSMIVTVNSCFPILELRINRGIIKKNFLRSGKDKKNCLIFSTLPYF